MTLLSILEANFFFRYTGAGKSVTDALLNGEEPPKAFAEAMDAIVSRVIAQNTRIFVDSEQDEFQQAIDKWTIDLMRRHNRDGKVFIFNTVQAYLKEARQKFEHQLKLAHKEGWTLAIKLVRGAYIDSDPRQIIHDTKDQTDDCYNGIVRDVLTGNMAGIPKSDFPRVDLFLAGHNAKSVAKASVLVQELAAKGELKTVPEFGQLQGMCDELGCKILQDGEESVKAIDGSEKHGVAPKVYKWSTWGTVQECMQYLVRRAVENRGATERMKDGMAELAKELRRRAGDRIMGR
jgi:proline dehydrogenase